MITFKYVARDYEGEIKEGMTQAVSEAEVLDWLRDQGCTPVTVDAISIGAKKKLHVPLFQRVTSAELAAVFWQMTRNARRT